jgi:adenylate cyclase
LNYDALDQSYWEAQKQRIASLRDKIKRRPAIGDGRVVPADDDLSICDGRRLSIAIMFIDICGFSSRPMDTAAEQDLMLRILNLYFTEMIRIAEEYGGNVEKNTGDGLLIYFNDNEGNPPASGPKRAVSCALTMFATTKYLLNPIIVNSNAKPI